uniref:uncharacterized protein LOC122587973 n=1 Tax=Erigeron canadensis TaxID=72917 RepID=UPI001CB915DD|nr:uncharacterized protein LOC122587973 [Erigeron canadensis]
MNILSINIRGVRGVGKGNWIKDVRESNGVDFLAMQETQSVGVSESCVRSYWGRSKMEWEVVDPVGRSGGIISVWDPGVFCKIDCVKDRNFMLIKGRIKGCEEMVYVMNVYAPQKVREKRDLWSRIAEIKERNDGLWFLIADFNAVRVQEERYGSALNYACTQSFNLLIAESDLHEYHMAGGKYTFLVNGDRGAKQSKIDRLLVSRNVIESCPVALFSVLSRRLSDHNPILFVVREISYGPEPFRFFSS